MSHVSLAPEPNYMPRPSPAVGADSEKILRLLAELAEAASSTAQRAPSRIEDELYALCAERRSAAALEHLLDWLDADLRAERFDEVNSLLRRLDVGRLAANVILGALTITAHAPLSRLPEREDFRVRAERALIRALGEGRAKALLAPRR